MKKTLGLLLVLLIMYLPASAQQVDLQQRAYDIIFDQLGFRGEDLLVEEEHLEEDFPVLIFRQKHHPDSDGRVFIQFRPDGSLHDLKGPTPNWLSRLDEAFLPLKKNAVWKAADMAALKEDWAPYLQDIRHRMMSQPEETWSFTLKNAKALLADIRQIEPGAISEEDAQQTAEKAILRLDGWNADKLAFYPLQISAYYFSQELQKPVYLLIFNQKSAGQVSEREFSQFEKDYLKPLAEAFDVMDAIFAPVFVSVRVDAFTGQVQGQPTVMALELGMRWPLEMLD